MIQRRDILYCEGPGDILAAHAAWAARGDITGETSVTFSEQLFECCRLEGLTFHAISYCERTMFAGRIEENKGVSRCNSRTECRDVFPLGRQRASVAAAHPGRFDLFAGCAQIANWAGMTIA